MAAGALAAGAPSAAWAGSYLNRAALLLDGSHADREMIRSRSHDKDLLEVVHRVATARAEAAKDMDVPAVVAAAHPHLLLALENTERAAAVAKSGSQQKFLEHLFRARTEDQIFRSIVEKLGYSLPRTGA